MNDINIQSISDEILTGWRVRGTDILKIGNNKKATIVSNINEMDQNSIYLKVRHKSNFEGFAEIEATIQTHDVSNSIINGEIPELVDFMGADIAYEYKVSPPANISSNSGINMPIVPDALIFKQPSGLYIESKHQVTESDVKSAINKVNFLQKYTSESWFLKERAGKYNNLILRNVMTSVGPVPSKLIINYPEVMFLARKGLRYIKV